MKTALAISLSRGGMKASLAIGLMRERILVQRNDPPILSVTSLTRASTTATATTAEPHRFLATDYVTISGAVPTGYAVKAKILSVPTPTTFTYTVSVALTTPATGTITVVYTSNAQGGVVGFWRDLDTVPAEMIPLGAFERLQIQAVQSDVAYRFRVRVRADLSPKMQLLWTPSWPPDVPQKTLAITGILPVGDGRAFSFIEASEVAA